MAYHKSSFYANFIMTNGNGDFPYWESDRTQPGGSTDSVEARAQQLEALQSYLNQRSGLNPLQGIVPQPLPDLSVQPPKQAQARALRCCESVATLKESAQIAEHPTITITAGKTRIDITITPL